MGIGLIGLAYILAGATAVAVAGIVTLAAMAYKAHRETMNVRDLLDAEQFRASEYKSQRDIEVAAHAVTSALLKETGERLSRAESQRNAVSRRLAEQLKGADIADAARIVSDLLADPLPGVSSIVPAADRSRAGGDDLEKP